MPCPIEYSYIKLSERFGGKPWEWEDAPADRALKYIRVMQAEAEIMNLLEGLAPDEELISEDDGDEDEERE